VVALVAEPLDELESRRGEGTGKHRRISGGAASCSSRWAPTSSSLLRRSAVLARGSNGKFTLSAFTSIPSQPGFGAASHSRCACGDHDGHHHGAHVPTAVYVHLRVPGCDGYSTASRSCRSSSRRSSSSSVSCSGTDRAEGHPDCSPLFTWCSPCVRLPVARRRAAGHRPQDPRRGVALTRRPLVQHALARRAAESARCAPLRPPSSPWPWCSASSRWRASTSTRPSCLDRQLRARRRHVSTPCRCSRWSAPGCSCC